MELVLCWNLKKQRRCKWCESPSFCSLQGHIVGRTFHCHYYLRGRTAGGKRLVLGFIWIDQKAGGGFGGKQRWENQPLWLGPSRVPIMSTFICSCTAERAHPILLRERWSHPSPLAFIWQCCFMDQRRSISMKMPVDSVGPRNFLGIPAAASARCPPKKPPFPTPLFKFLFRKTSFFYRVCKRLFVQQNNE